ncbi:glycosyl hydrolases family 31-domain-containing protein [Phycomyces nitens]|nr:glycosyl hydrolases family 31-domain-containing protein [Phycomyces nitens]
MLQSVLNNIGLGTQDLIQPRLSIGTAVADEAYTIGDFSVHLDAQIEALVIKNSKERIIWKSLDHTPFLSSTSGTDDIGPGEGGVFKIIEHDQDPTHLQTITHVEHTDESIVIFGGLTTKLIQPTHLDYTFTLRVVSPRQLQFSAKFLHKDPSMVDHNRVILTYRSRKEEEFYGFGEQFSYTSFKGQKVPVFVREQGIGRGDQPITALLNSSFGMFGEFAGGDYFTTYASVPQYITTDNQCLFLETSEYASFDLKQHDRVVVRLNSNTMTGRILDGDSMLDLISEYTLYCGRMTVLPDWISEGAVAGIQGGAVKVRDIVKQLKSYDTPLAAVWLQDWCGRRVQNIGSKISFKRLWWNWESDNSLYPHWKDFVQEMLHQENGSVRVLSYVNPFLINVEDKQGARRNLFLEAQNKGYLVKDPSNPSESKTLIINSGPDFEAGLLDITFPEARIWFKQVLKDQVWEAGVSGMMADFGEYLPYSSKRASLHSGIAPETYHNRYPEDWASLNHEVIKELGLENEAVNFYRSGYTRSPGYMNLMWAGDQNVTWDQNDGIKSAVIGMLSGGFSGFSVTHSDIGGYTTLEGLMPGLKITRSRDLLYRWMELAAFTAVFRTHEGTIPESNAQFYDSEESYIHFSHTAKLFKSLSPYRKHLIREANEKGWPLMRHLVLYYPSDPTVRELTYQQFMLGSALLVAPTLSPSTTFVKVYFPKENTKEIFWRHIWTGKYYPADGKYVTIDTPFGLPAAFIKEPREDDGLLNKLLEFASDHYNHHQINQKNGT